LFDDFTRSFYQSDVLVLLPIYAAGEDKIQGVDSQLLCEGIKQHGHKDACFFDDMGKAVAHVKQIAGKDDIVLTLGAGDIWKAGGMLLSGGNKNENI
jgi:UDP-N-acetylmuramate--alanine ligase